MRFLALLLITFSLATQASTNQWEGVPFPAFELKDQFGKVRKNQDFDGKWKIVYFYPKDKTPGCTVEAQNFTDDYEKYQKRNVEIIGVSYDGVESHKDFADTYEIPFTLLADTKAKLSKQMKVDKIFPWPHASRQTFVVDPSGKIAAHIESVSPKTHSAELLTMLNELQSKGKQ